MSVSNSSIPGADAYWDQQWNSAEGRQSWLVPETDVEEMIERLRQRGVRKVLDLGCGVGRHALFLVRSGFDVTALDLSPNGLEHLREQAAGSGLTLDLRLGPMTNLSRAQPYPPDSAGAPSATGIETGSMDYVLAWNVIYHGDLQALAASLAEIARVLRGGGLFQGTLLSKRNANFGRGRELAPDTWVNEAVDDKSHPHCYRSKMEADAMLHAAGLMPLDLRDVQHEKPDSYHWHVVAERRASPPTRENLS